MLQPNDKIISEDMTHDSFINMADRPIVFTNGVFDLVHRGHLEYLYEARTLGKALIVGINSDNSVKELAKGFGRPINTAYDRAYIIAGLVCVDAVIIFNSPTPENLIKRIKPEIYVKGGDYQIETLPEAKVVSEYNGKTKILNYTSGYSTTKIISKVIKSSGYEAE